LLYDTAREHYGENRLRPGKRSKGSGRNKRALHFLRADAYEVAYGDDEAGDLAIKLENGDAQQTITLEAHAWPEDIFNRVLAELKI
jgi:hypothetical protein